MGYAPFHWIPFHRLIRWKYVSLHLFLKKWNAHDVKLTLILILTLDLAN